MALRPWLHLLLVPAFLLANLLCTCAHATEPATPQALVKAHGCCEHKADQADAETTAKSPDQPHDPARCPHCVDKGKVLADDGVSPAATVAAFVAALPPLRWALFAVLEQPSPSRFDVPCALAMPPPDLLRVKCTLQV